MNFTLDELVGPEERNWTHYVSRHTGRTLCGFTPADYGTMELRNPFSLEAPCPDCARAKAALDAGGKPKMQPPGREPDVTIKRRGTIAILYAHSARARAWLEKEVGLQGYTDGGIPFQIDLLGTCVRKMAEAGIDYIKFEDA